ncbi:hypothetical protein GWK47_053708 [Chionoecetes opilio]|uniref:Uncharacterized protein n=1 Tax=Chionoecetes opilio TaxID=41210 RepID=A0A8J5CR36_CHIOP|nr:hypothetical protein GWK47_053708 [Chionoecetes opilio]
MTHDGACRCLREHAAVLDGAMRVQLVQQWIEGIKANKPCIPEAVNVMLDLAADLSAEQLRPIIEGHLSSGLDVILKTPSFNADLTAVFNQLADENTAECSGRHVWLCLQSGREVVEQAVRRAVTMTGLVPVMVQTLADLPQVCQAKLPSGQSLLASSLAARQTSGLCDREERDFVVLVQSLLRRKGLLDAQEVLHLMVEPFLVIEGSRKLDKLITPLELLQELVGQDGEVVVRAGPAVVSLVLALAHVVDATVALEGQGPDGLLDIRCLASAILMEITNIIMSRQKKFEREISVLKGLVCRSGLHPWSVVQLSQLLDAEPRQDSGADLLLRVLVKAAPDLPRGHGLNPVTCAQADGEGLQKLSRSEWTISLLQLLPHCSEREWISAFFLTDHFHGSQYSVSCILKPN